MKNKAQRVRDLAPAPGELRRFQAFVNSADREAGTDELASPRELAAWLARHGLLAPGTELTAADRQRAVAAREGWRALLAGAPNADEAAAAVDRVTAAAPLRTRSGPGGVMRLEPAAGGLDGALGRLQAIALEAQADGSWRRLKACASPTCRALFFDRSKNHSRRWCRSRCGNRLPSRISKRRQRHAYRQAKEAKRRARALELDPVEQPSLAELENGSALGKYDWREPGA